jgi:hypothetical protein
MTSVLGDVGRIHLLSTSLQVSCRGMVSVGQQ